MTGFNLEFDGYSTLEIPRKVATNDQSSIVSTAVAGSLDIVIDWLKYSPDMLKSRVSFTLKLVFTQAIIYDISNNKEYIENINSHA